MIHNFWWAWFVLAVALWFSQLIVSAYSDSLGLADWSSSTNSNENTRPKKLRFNGLERRFRT
jgi:hypothetical protein